ncbi:retropepsin-like aspartic protease [Pedobacter sp. MW01-1-1]|uniref:retropepsin-like aspartic protease n=1 Tax=Pedobacter sp. MW01-1-1 TaxID=3383027 RepID=UPI003FF09690
MKSKIILAALILGAFNLARAQQGAKDLIRQLNQTWATKSVDGLEKQLSPDFSVAAYTENTALNLLKGIVQQYPCDSVQYSGESKLNQGNKITITPFNKGKQGAQSSIITNEKYQILYLDIFDQLYGMNRYKPSKLRAKIPFEVQNGSIILSLKINNYPKPLRMLFDTGADGMAINTALASEIGLKSSREQNATVVGGNVKITVSEGNTIMLDTFAVKNQSIAIFPEMHRDADGIIGNNITKKYITKVDYDKKELSLYDFGQYTYEDKGISVPIKSGSGIFIIPGDVTVTAGQTHTGNFVFDTGAGYNLICFRPFVKKNKLLVSGFKSEYNGSTTSMGMSTPTFAGTAVSFSFSNVPPLTNFPITLMAGGGQSETWNPGFDGSIGIRTISRYNFTVNLQNQEIHFVPNASFKFPHDFYIAGYIFGFDGSGILKVNSAMRTGDTLKVGTPVNSINGIATKTLLTNPKKMNAITTATPGTAIKIEFISNGQNKTEVLTK